MANYEILFKGSNDSKNDSLECFGMSGRLYVVTLLANGRF